MRSPERVDVPAPGDAADPRAWCVVAVARLARDQYEDALSAAREAVTRDPSGEWGHRLASLALERLGRDEDAVLEAQRAVELSPGSWAARLRLAASLRRFPGRWREAWRHARRAVAYAPEEPDPHVLVGDLALLRGDHEGAEAAYEIALQREPYHPGALTNLSLVLLNWDHPRGHHDPLWPVDPSLTGRARRVLEHWSRQVRLALALALIPMAALAFGLQTPWAARLAGGAALLAGLGLTLWHSRRIPAWQYVPGMLGRDMWLGLSVTITLVVAGAFLALTLLITTPIGALLAGLIGLVALNGPAVVAVRVLAEAWRGRLIPALGQLASSLRVMPADRAGRRNLDVVLWLFAGRLWGLVALVGVTPLIPWAPARICLGAGAVLLLGAMLWVIQRAGLTPYLPRVLGRDRWLGAAYAAMIGALLLLGLSAILPSFPWWSGLVALGLAVVVFAARASRAWWRGAPGPWRASLILSESCGPRLPGDAVPSVEVSTAVRRAFAYSRSVVLAMVGGRTGPRAVAVSAVIDVGEGGELRVIAGEEVWSAVRSDPRVAIYAADPFDRRSWVELRGVALIDEPNQVLRITPKHVIVGEVPGRHQSRTETP